MSRLVLATGNPHKIREIAPLLAGTRLELVAAGELVEDWDVDETGETLEENARLKAAAAVAATGLPAVSDDTGLFVDALGGQPGVRSSRYAGERATYADNVSRLLTALGPTPATERAARFRTVVVLRRPHGAERIFTGELPGTIATAPRGVGGFGYDPVFEVAGDGRTLAELLPEEKSAVSHRALAFAELARFLAREPDWLRPV